MGKVKAAKAKVESKVEDTIALLKAQAEELQSKGWVLMAQQAERIAARIAKKAAKRAAAKAAPETPADG